nr:retrovirus-related Pol polyprotein from transposon TNT 1-94 [Tanacetum cinerariifolium]
MFRINPDTPGMFRINPDKTSREAKKVPNTVSASNMTKPITVSQPPVFTRIYVNSNLNGLSSTRVDNTKTRRPQPRSNTKNDMKQMAKVSVKEIQKKYQPKVTKLKKVGTHESLATPKPRKPRLLLRWSLTGRLFDHEGKLVASSNSKSQYDCSNGDNACTSNAMEPKIKRFPNSTSLLDRNDHVAAILGFGDLLGHNLFSVGQFCDLDPEVAFRGNACFVRNLEGVDLLKGDRSTNIYTINLHEMASALPICLMAHTSSTKSWLWHQRLSHLNFDTINDLARNDLVAGLPQFKYHKEHLCPSCEQGKSKRASHPPKPVLNSRQTLHLLHMDLCGPMRIASINGKRYVLVIIDDYSRYTWVHFLRSKDEAPEVIIKFLKRITVLLQSPVIIIRTNNGIKFKNQVLKEYFDTTLVEAARPMLIFSRAALFLWAEAIATACFTQNHSIIHCRFNKIPYELINGRKPDISFLHVFDALCYPKNDREDIGKLGAKGDIGFFIGSKPGLQSMTSGHISSGLDLTYAPSTITTQQPSECELDLLFDDYIGGQPSATARIVLPAQELQVRQSSTASTTIANTDSIPTNSSSHATNIPISSQDVDELNLNAMVDGNTFVNPFANSSTSVAASSSLQNVDPSNMHTFYQPYPHEFQWTKDHPLEQVIGEPSRPVLTRSHYR